MVNRGSGPHRVAVLTLPGVSALEFGIATQVFATNGQYELTICADRQNGPVAGPGFIVHAAAGLEALSDADTVIVPAYEDVDSAPEPGILAALRVAHSRGTRLASICTGAFALAAAGLLDGRPATTHWQYTDLLRQRFPRVDVQPNRLYVDDGDILTSAGITAGVDLCLHILRRDQGAAVANACARFLVAQPQRQGGQSQFIDRLRPEAVGSELASLREWMLENVAENQTIDDLARRAHMSRRTFVRRFREETGTSPMAWLADARIDRARELLETTTMAIEQVGYAVGLGAPASVRAAFHRRIGTSPSEYRAVFRHLV